MNNKLQKYLLIGIISLVIVLIVLRMFYNYQVNKYQWSNDDRIELVADCLEDAAHYAVRFPSLTTQYCECQADSIIANIKKAEYNMISSKPMSEQEEILLPIISSCYNKYQTAIFDATELGD